MKRRQIPVIDTGALCITKWDTVVCGVNPVAESMRTVAEMEASALTKEGRERQKARAEGKRRKEIRAGARRSQGWWGCIYLSDVAGAWRR